MHIARVRTSTNATMAKGTLIDLHTDTRVYSLVLVLCGLWLYLQWPTRSGSHLARLTRVLLLDWDMLLRAADSSVCRSCQHGYKYLQSALAAFVILLLSLIEQLAVGPTDHTSNQQGNS